MRNIFVLPTDKYSELVHSTNKYGGYFLSRHYSPMKDMGDSYQNIYITDDSKIKEGDWYITGKFVWQMKYKQWGEEGQGDAKKIILTTDQDLIKDGVQAIDDEFLEWFVKNPSCEFIEVERDSREVGGHNGGATIEYGLYEIIFPKEDLKQEILEEVAERLYPISKYENQDGKVEDLNENDRLRFIEGAKSDAAKNYWFKIFKNK